MYAFKVVRHTQGDVITRAGAGALEVLAGCISIGFFCMLAQHPGDKLLLRKGPLCLQMRERVSMPLRDCRAWPPRCTCASREKVTDSMSTSAWRAWDARSAAA
jgi:hypothetical protein